MCGADYTTTYGAIYECSLAAGSVLQEIRRKPCPTCGKLDPYLVDVDEADCWLCLADELAQEAFLVLDREHGR